MMQMGKPMVPGMGGAQQPGMQGQMTPEMMQRMAMMKAMQQQGGQGQQFMPQIQNFLPNYR